MADSGPNTQQNADCLNADISRRDPGVKVSGESVPSSGVDLEQSAMISDSGRNLPGKSVPDPGVRVDSEQPDNSESGISSHGQPIILRSTSSNQDSTDTSWDLSPSGNGSDETFSSADTSIKETEDQLELENPPEGKRDNKNARREQDDKNAMLPEWVNIFRNVYGTSVEAIRQFDSNVPKQPTERNIFDQIYYSILVVLETFMNYSRSRSDNVDQMYQSMHNRKGDLYQASARVILDILPPMNNNLPYPKAKELVGLRHAAAHTNTYVLQTNAGAMIALYKMGNKKKKMLVKVYECRYEDLCAICADIRTAFLTNYDNQSLPLPEWQEAQPENP